MFRSIKQAFKQTFRNRAMMLTSMFSITAMLLILGLFFILVVNINLMTENAKQKFDTIQIYLLDDTTEEQYTQMKNDLEAMDEVTSAEFVSKETAMLELEQRWGDNGYLLEGLSTNPLPNSLRVKIVEIEDADKVVAIAKSFAGIEDIKYYKTEVDQILKITKGIQTGALVIIGFLVIISVVVVSNTVKLTVLARGREIGIMKYIGATNWFVRGPFLVEGMIIGTLASLISSGIITAMYYNISKAFSDEALILFSTGFVPVEFMTKNLIMIFLALGVSIGAVGSIISMRRFLDR